MADPSWKPRARLKIKSKDWYRNYLVKKKLTTLISSPTKLNLKYNKLGGFRVSYK